MAPPVEQETLSGGPAMVETQAGSISGGSDPDRPSRLREFVAGEGVGRYLILAKLGTGGMGVVYAAWDPVLDRRIALKLLLQGRRDDAQARLLREAQAIARLLHPNVIAVHDVGVHEGVVFVAMEYVDGETLRGWQQSRTRSLDEILTVYLGAAEGLAAAHAAGLVHRDFKPDNVMVGHDGRPRVLDFGLARVESSHESAARWSASTPQELRSHSGGEAALSTDLTREGAVLGTPAYMSPEQFAGLPADARSDQFSWCVSLYEALYGERPFEGASFAALSFAVTSGKVRPVPAQRVADRGVRGTIPSSVRAILLRGLRPDPSDRYADLASLRRAIEAARAGQDRRPRRVAIAAVVGAMALAIFLLRPSADPCGAVQEQAQQQWSPRRGQELFAAFSTAGSEFEAAGTLVRDKVTAWFDGYVAARRETCEASVVRQELSASIMDDRVRCLERSRREVETVLASFASAAPAILAKALERADALPSIERCMDLDALALELEPPSQEERERVDALHDHLVLARTLLDAGVPGKAREPLSAAESLAIELHYEPILLELALVQGMEDRLAGRYEDAVARWRTTHFAARSLGAWSLAVESALSIANTFDRHLQRPVDSMLWADNAQADGGRVEPGLADAVAIQRALSSADATRDEATYAEITALVDRLQAEQGTASLAYVRALAARGRIEWILGKVDAALESQRRALELTQALVGPAHPMNIRIRASLGGALLRSGDVGEAIEVLEAGIAIAERTLGKDHPETADIRYNIGGAYAMARRNDDALAAYLEVERVWRATFAPDHSDLGALDNNIATMLRRQGKVDEAIARHERGVAIIQKALGENNDDAARGVMSLAMCWELKGDLERATKLYEQAAAMQMTTLGPKVADTGDAIYNVASMYESLDRFADADREYQRALEIYEATIGPQSPNALLARASMIRSRLRHSPKDANAQDVAPLIDALGDREIDPSLRIDLDQVLAAALLLEGRPCGEVGAIWRRALDRARTIDEQTTQATYEEARDWSTAGGGRCKAALLAATRAP